MPAAADTVTYEGRTYPFKIAGIGVGRTERPDRCRGRGLRPEEHRRVPGRLRPGQYGAVAGKESVGDMWLETRTFHPAPQSQARGADVSVGADAIDIKMDQ